jgi:hypothetical protein
LEDVNIGSKGEIQPKKAKSGWHVAVAAAISQCAIRAFYQQGEVNSGNHSLARKWTHARSGERQDASSAVATATTTPGLAT